MNHRSRSGFTLVELLAVMAIISLLSSIVLASVQQARAKSRDARRVSDMRQLVTALELYYQDHQKFPCVGDVGSELGGFLQPLVDGRYVNHEIRDPLNDENYAYYYASHKSKPGGPCGQLFHLSFWREVNGTPCPLGRYDIDGGTHCHVFYPQTIPTNFDPPCDDPFADKYDTFSDMPPGCQQLWDREYCPYDNLC